MSFPEFLQQIGHNPALLITVILTLAAIMINGVTDACNSIATCISTKAITPKRATIMAAIFNVLGVVIMTILNGTVAATIMKMVDFGEQTNYALIALCASLCGILIWSTIAWFFGIPTSESHALIAGLTGSAIAVQGNFSGINGAEWIKVVYGLGLSTILGFVLGWLTVKGIELICKKMDYRKTKPFFKNSQIVGGAAVSFMHGAQDGQKFIGIFLLGTYLARGDSVIEGTITVPLWIIIICAAFMGLGTAIGGYRIIKKVGMDMVKLEQYQGFATDIATAGALLVSSLYGIPVSTTHTKTTSIMGVGAAKRLSNVRWDVVRDLGLTWILTFPGCGLIGFLLAKLFIHIF